MTEDTLIQKPHKTLYVLRGFCLRKNQATALVLIRALIVSNLFL